MELGIIILGIVGLLGAFSIWQNGRKNAVVSNVILEFLEDRDGTLVEMIRPTESGPFKDEYYDEQDDNLYQNIGYQPKETIYRVVTYTLPDGTTKKGWVQVRVEHLKVTYKAWKDE